jgi:dynein heavy chain, axonemal
LSQEPTDLEQLKFVLNAIAAVANSRMDMELEYLDVMERYRTLKHYEVQKHCL